MRHKHGRGTFRRIGGYFFLAFPAGRIWSSQLNYSRYSVDHYHAACTAWDNGFLKKDAGLPVPAAICRHPHELNLLQIIS
jgi:hypothetical protein